MLVNNAGAVIGTRQETVDGFETTIGVNHLGPFLLTHLLAPALVAAPAGRVVTVASLAHRQGELDLDDLMFERRPYQSMLVYGTSKLANVLFARELAHRLGPTGVTSVSLHPGTVRSGFGRSGHWLLQLGVRIAAPLFVDAERGASTSVHAAAAPAMEGVSGVHLSRRRVVTPSAAARDDRLARGLWDRSAALVGVAPDALRRAQPGRLTGQVTSTTRSREDGPAVPATRSCVASRCRTAASTNSSPRRSRSSAVSIAPS